MSFDYIDARATATELITDFGQAATLEKPGTATGPAYDPTLGAPVTYAVTVVDLNITKRSYSENTITETKRTLYIAAGGAVPAKGDRVQVGGVWHSILEARPLAPGGIDVMYEADIGV